MKTTLAKPGISLLAELRWRLTELETLKADPEGIHGIIVWREKQLSFRALDALPMFLEMGEILADTDSGDGLAGLSVQKLMRLWQIVTVLMKEGERHDTAEDRG